MNTPPLPHSIPVEYEAPTVNVVSLCAPKALCLTSAQIEELEEIIFELS